MAAAVAVPAAAQTTQWSQPVTTVRWSQAPEKKAPAPAPKTEIWSQPTTTERWSEAPSPAPRASNGQSGTTEIWSSPSYTRQVDPRLMEEPEVVAGGGPLEPGLAGTWDLWVPGGIWYSSDGASVYRNYTPGAAVNRLSIGADGSYRWGGFGGRLTEVRPWFAQEGQRYFAVQMDAKNRYMARLDPEDGKLRLFFWGVGGHAATGTRR